MMKTNVSIRSNKSNISTISRDYSHIVDHSGFAQSEDPQSAVHSFISQRFPRSTPPIRFCLSNRMDNDSRSQQKQESQHTSVHVVPNQMTNGSSVRPVTSSATIQMNRQPSITPPLQYVNVNADNYIRSEQVYTSTGSKLKSLVRKQSIMVEQTTKEMKKPRLLRFQSDNHIQAVSRQEKYEPSNASSRSLSQPANDVDRIRISFIQRLNRHAKVIKWLDDLGVSLFESVDLNAIISESTVNEAMESIRNGTKLAEIVERLEGTPVAGIERKPSKTGAIYNNVNRVLTVLRTKKNLNPQYLWSNREIMEGNEDVIWGLLEHIFEVYGKRVYATRRKPAKPTNKSRDLKRKTNQNA